MKHIITTCGNSILGGRRPEIEAIEGLIKKRIAEMQDSDDFLKRISAETNGLSALQANKNDQVSLLVTDTPDGLRTAICLKKLIEDSYNCDVCMKQVEGLQVDDPDVFRRKGVSNLFSTIDELRERYHGVPVLNSSGGFKAVVPYIVLYGLINQIEVAYIFERSENLVKLPPAPLGIDYTRASKFTPVLKWVNSEGCVPTIDFQKQAQKVPYHDQEWFSSLFYEDEGFVYLSAFGEIVISKFSESVLEVKLSQNAFASLEAASESEKQIYANMLSKIQNPGQRNMHIHRWQGTDLLIHKPGSVPERAAYFIQDGFINICALFLEHDGYERKLKGKRISDFKEEEFKEYKITVEETFTGSSNEHESKINELEEAKKDLQHKLSECRKTLAVTSEN